MSTSMFKQSLEFGRAGESVIAQWLIGRGCSVLPAYEKLIEENKGPQLFTPNGSRIVPDLFVFGNGCVTWVEAKHKTAFTWHRKTSQFVTGIDVRHYQEYCQVDDETGWPVWLLFLHRGGTAKDSPPSPSGLYGNSLEMLRLCENHRHKNWGRSGMVYWAIKSLKKLDSLENVLSKQYKVAI